MSATRTTAPSLACIPGHLPFLDSLARRWLLKDAAEDRTGPDGYDPEAAGRGMILLPTRRAARALTETFLRLAGGRVLLLPRIVAIGALDETPLTLAGALDLPPAVEPMRRLAVLSRMILAAGHHFGAAPAADHAWVLAQFLAELMDEAERAEADLATHLPRLAENHAEHWARTLDFLDIVTRVWPQWLDENQVMNPVARQVALLRTQAAAWSRQPPDGPVWAAGITAASPALVALLAVIARLPEGIVVFPALDRDLERAAFEALPESHAQAGLAALLAGIGARREDVPDWSAEPDEASLRIPEGRVRALHAALLPEQALGAWLEDAAPADLAGLSRLSPADQQEEAAAIALVLRHAIEMPGRLAALITPDRALAARVVVELTRFGVMVDDSAGETLACSPPAVLLRLLIQACADGLPPVALLALLKHPLAAMGRSIGECRGLARALELACLRGPAPKPGIAGLREALSRAREDPRRTVRDADALEGFLDDLERVLAPLLAACATDAPQPVPLLLDAMLRAGEALAATDTLGGEDRLWLHEDGNALAEHLTALATHADTLPPQPARVLGGLLDASLVGVAVRSRRALRGRSAQEEHPRILIWGLLEARLQSVGLAVLGGLVEGVWPPATDPGPWMSRPMRVQAGLPSPEAAIGQSAQDFLASVCAAPEVVLSCPRRREGAPAVPARWLVRLDAWLLGRQQRLPGHPALSWLRRLDQPDGAPRPVAAPAPRPPVALRPRRLSITEIETWMRDPYAIHARHVLRLHPLRPLEEAADAADYGVIVHDALQAFLGAHGAAWPTDAAPPLRAAFTRALADAGLRPALAAWWRPRLLRIADWVARTEQERRGRQAPVRIGSELAGQAIISGLAGGDFTLRGRADRIECYPDGSLSLLDYKTGALPAATAVKAGWSSQLVLEAAMARIGAFGEAFQGETAAMAYWSLSGGHEPGRVLVPVRDAAALQGLVAQCWSSLGELVAAYDDPQQAYLSQPRPDEAPRFTDYAGLARVAEWSAAREDGT